MNDPIDALLADLHTDVPDMSDEAFEAGRSRLRSIVAQEPVLAPEPDVAVVPLRKRRLLRSPPRRMVTVAAAAAAAVALAAGMLAVQTARRDAAAPTGNAAEQLNVVADRINPVDEPIEPDQYRYIVTHRWTKHVASTEREPGPNGEAPNEDIQYLVETVEEQWVPADPARECTTRVTTTGKLKWMVGSAEKALNAGLELPQPESHDDPRPCHDDSLGWMAPSTELLASLPRDPAQLNDRLRNDDQRTRITIDPDLTLVSNAAFLLETGMVPADLRAALYRTIALTPGLEIIEQIDNLDGNKGTVFSITRKTSRQEVIIDTATGQFIGSRWIGKANPGVSGRIESHRPQKDSVVSYVAPSNPVIVDEVGETS
jgi:hypothetical protein